MALRLVYGNDTVRCYTILHNTARFYMVLLGTARYYMIFNDTLIRYYTILYDFIWYSRVLRDTTRYYTILYDTITKKKITKRETRRLLRSLRRPPEYEETLKDSSKRANWGDKGDQRTQRYPKGPQRHPISRVWVMTPSICSGRITFFRLLVLSKSSMSNTSRHRGISSIQHQSEILRLYRPSLTWRTERYHVSCTLWHGRSSSPLPSRPFPAPLRLSWRPCNHRNEGRQHCLHA